MCACQIQEVINDPTCNSPGSASRRNNDVRQDLIARRAAHQAELKRFDEEIRVIEDLRRQEIQSIQDITQQIDALDERVPSVPAVIQNYFDEFEWSGKMKAQMRRVFGIENFRLAQEGCAIFTATSRTTPSEYRKNSVCNANMDGRDIICIMPTGKWDTFRAESIDGPLLTRGREITYIPATCDANARVHAGYLATCIPHERSITPFTRKR